MTKNSASISKSLVVDAAMFKVNNVFLAGSVIILGILVILYYVLW